MCGARSTVRRPTSRRPTTRSGRCGTPHTPSSTPAGPAACSSSAWSSQRFSDVSTTRAVLAAAGDALLGERRPLTDDELAELASLSADAVPALAALAHEVRLAWCGPV